MVGVESPGYPSLRKVPTALGHRIVGLPTDDHGLDPEGLPTGSDATNLDAVLITPSHQYPWGGSLSASRRAAVIEWAERAGCWIIEDDFDSELRHVGAPLPALASLDEEHTILLGTFSSVLTPALGCGYLVIPPDLMHPFAEQRQATGQPVPAIVQEAVADYLSTGAATPSSTFSGRYPVRHCSRSTVGCMPCCSSTGPRRTSSDSVVMKGSASLPCRPTGDRLTPTRLGSCWVSEATTTTPWQRP